MPGQSADTVAPMPLAARVHSLEEKVGQRMDGIEDKLDTLSTEVAILVDRSEHYANNCPMRVDIARAGNGATEARAEAATALKLAEKAVDLTIENRVGIAKMAAVAAGGGLTGGVATAILQYLMYLLQSNI